MISYKFSAPMDGSIETVDRFPGGSTIPLNMDNRDYQQFLVDWEAGATVLSSTGVPLPWGSEPS